MLSIEIVLITPFLVLCGKMCLLSHCTKPPLRGGWRGYKKSQSKAVFTVHDWDKKCVKYEDKLVEHLCLTD